MNNDRSALKNWTPEQIAQGLRWVETWKLAGADLERIHRQEIREIDTYQTMRCFAAPQTTIVLSAPLNPFLGLVEQATVVYEGSGP